MVDRSISKDEFIKEVRQNYLCADNGLGCVMKNKEPGTWSCRYVEIEDSYQRGCIPDEVNTDICGKVNIEDTIEASWVMWHEENVILVNIPFVLIDGLVKQANEWCKEKMCEK